MTTTIESFQINYVDIDASQKFRVIVYSPVKDLTEDIFLIVGKDMYDQKFIQYSDLFKKESGQHSQMRTVEHFMYLHGVIDTLFLNTITDFHTVDLESEITIQTISSEKRINKFSGI